MAADMIVAAGPHTGGRVGRDQQQAKPDVHCT